MSKKGWNPCFGSNHWDASKYSSGQLVLEMSILEPTKKSFGAPFLGGRADFLTKLTTFLGRPFPVSSAPLEFALQGWVSSNVVGLDSGWRNPRLLKHWKLYRSREFFCEGLEASEINTISDELVPSWHWTSDVFLEKTTKHHHSAQQITHHHCHFEVESQIWEKIIFLKGCYWKKTTREVSLLISGQVHCSTKEIRFRQSFHRSLGIQNEPEKNYISHVYTTLLLIALTM